MECSVSLGESQRFTAGNVVRSDAFWGRLPPASPRSPAASHAAPEVWVWFVFNLCVCECFRVFPRRQLNPPLTAPVRAVFEKFKLEPQPRWKSGTIGTAVFRDNNTHALRPPAPGRGCTSAVAAVEIQPVCNLPKTIL